MSIHIRLEMVRRGDPKESTPALDTKYSIVATMSSGNPARFAGTLSNKLENIFPSALIGFIALYVSQRSFQSITYQKLQSANH